MANRNMALWVVKVTFELQSFTVSKINDSFLIQICILGLKAVDLYVFAFQVLES